MEDVRALQLVNNNKIMSKSEEKKYIEQIGEKKKEGDEATPKAEEKVEEKWEEIDDKEWCGASYIHSDGSLIDMLFDEEKRTTKLAVYKDGQVSIEESVRIDDEKVFKPLSPNNSLLKNGFTIFPSEVGDYQSNEALYYEVRAFVDKYVQLSDEFLSVVAVYTMMTWVYDQFRTIPYLRVTGLWGSGKSRLLTVAGSLCYKTMMTGGSISNAALFRSLDLLSPTLVFDEAELGEKESVEMRQVLRQGYSAGTPVYRMEKVDDGKMYVQTFDVFGPKIIASLARFQDIALESRCLTGWMPPHMNSGRPIELNKEFKQEALRLRNKLLMFRFKNHHLVAPDESVLGGISLPRLKQTGLAVMSVAKMLGIQPVEDVRKFLIEYEQELGIEQADSVENDILLSILDLLTQSGIKYAGKIRTGVDLAERFNSLHYEDYSSRETKEYNSSSTGLMKYPGSKVSAKKIGWYVRKMGFRVDRDARGFYISIVKEYPKIRLLAKRYGLDSLFELPETNPSGVKRVVDAVEKLNNLKLKEEGKKKKEEEERRKKAVEEMERNRKPMSDKESDEIFGSSLEKDNPKQS